MENAKNYFYGIDLGTTNSVMAYGNITNTGILKPIVVDIDRKSDNGSRSRGKLLPSVVFYYKDNEGRMVPEVGDYAKSRYGTKSGYVSKSIKSLMGQNEGVNLAEEIEDQTPAAVSAQILKHMIRSAKSRLFQDQINDVIITVPASFDSDQCQATLDAAKYAGIDIDNQHDILLYEPKAVIYDFLQMQESGEIPSSVIDLSEPKNILVFDLGGGTLDVTIHRVGYSESGILNIKDIAISRYTQIGGDDFDELIANEMMKRFQEQSMITINIKRKEEVMCKLRRLAEHLKMDMSNDYERCQEMGSELSDDYYEEVMEINLYDSYSYADEFTKKELEEIIAPMLGEMYTIEDAKRIDSMTEKDMNNIIYPILDVLSKAGENCKIDTVILNGGMTKLYPVKNRIEQFFGFRALTTSDPDLAVARGAVYYHYCLHKYNIQKSKNIFEETKEEIEKTVFHTGTIMNDRVNLGIRNQYVSKLIEAGTNLPYISDEISGKYQMGKDSDTLALDIFLGRGMTKDLPNRRIARRLIKFKKVYPAGTPISLRIMIDSMRMMTMEAWITDRPRERAVIEIDTNTSKEVSEEKVKSRIYSNESLILNAKSELNDIKVLMERNKTMKKKDEINQKINDRIIEIGKAQNPADFFEPIVEMVNTCYQSDILLGYLYEIASKLCYGWSDPQKRKMKRLVARHFQEQARYVAQNVYVLRKAIDLLAALGGEFIEDYKEYFEQHMIPEAIQYALYENALRYEKEDLKVLEFIKDRKITELSPRSIQALIKRFGIGTEKKNQNMLKDLIKSTAEFIISGECTHTEYYLMLEAQLCGCEVNHALLGNKKLMKLVRASIDHYYEGRQKDSFYCTFQNLLDDIPLLEEEEELVKRYCE